MLFVAPFPPRLAGTHGGAKVVGQVVAGTAERHAVGLVYLRHRGEPDLDDALRERLELAEAVERPRADRRSAAHWARAAHWRAGLLAGRPRLIGELTFASASSRLRATAAAWRPDVVRLEYPAVGGYLPALGESAAARVLADYDALLETARAPRSPGERVEHFLDLRAWRRFRRRILDRVHAAIVPTERDRAVLAGLEGAAKILAIPFGADVDAPALDPAGKEHGGVLFVGNFNHVPNCDSAELLLEALPRIRTHHPDAVLRLVGERPPDVSAHEGVEAPGRVPDVTPFLDAAEVVVAPALTGGGMRVKVVDALVAGKALVATPLAVAGLPLEPGRHAVVVDPAGLADAVAELLSDRARRIELGTNARQWALANLGWERALDEYDVLYRRLVSRAARGRP